MVFTVANCIAWLAYGLTLRNWFLGPPNVVGMLLGLGQLLCALSLGVPDARQRNLVMLTTVFLAACLASVGILCGLVFADEPQVSQQLWGYTGVLSSPRYTEDRE